MNEIFTKTDYEDDRVPPRSRKLVAVCSWSWGPANSRVDTYCLSGSRSRKEWRLWLKPFDSDLGTYWVNLAFGRFAECISARDAAKILLNSAWMAEWKAYESPGSGAYVDRAGLLDQADIIEIEKSIYGDDQSTANQ